MYINRIIIARKNVEKLKQIDLNEPQTPHVKESNVDNTEKVSKLSIFDIEHEEIQNRRAADDIALNGAKLIREQLNISSNSE